MPEEIDLKFDRGKIRIDLIDPGFIKEIGEVMELGARKYEEESWKHLENGHQRHTAALLRHLYAYLDGEEFDEETGSSHLINCAFNLMCMRWADRNKVRSTPENACRPETFREEVCEELITERGDEDDFRSANATD